MWKSELVNITRAWDKEKIPLITTHDDFDNADPRSMQDACHIWTQLNDLVLYEFSQLSG